MFVRKATLTIFAWLLVGLCAPSAMAVTPTQNAAAEAKAKAEMATRLKLQTETRKRLEAQTKSQSDSQAKTRALAIGKLAVHNETKLRLEAARKAAALHARIIAQQGANSPIRAKNQRKPVLRHIHEKARAKALAANKSK